MARSGIELVWSTKQRVAPIVGDYEDLDLRERIEGPLSTSPREHPDGTAQPHQLGLALHTEDARAEDPSWQNLLVHGDNAVAMRALAQRFAGGIEVVYIDPPFATGLTYYSQAQAGVGAGTIERTAYQDGRAGGLTDYLDALYERLALVRVLLSDTGKLFVHCDWRANSMLRLILDELFGAECFRNEIVWRRAPNLGRQAASRQLGRVFDTVLVYSKTPGSAFAGTPPKRSNPVTLDRNGKPKGARWDPEREAYFTTAPRGDYTDESVAELRKQGRVYDSSSGTVYIKYFLRKDDDGTWVKDQPVDALWDDFDVRPLRHRPKSEDMGYDTQKPEGLLERILGWASKPGDLVADFYCGSGTTLAVAERLGRRWIGCDAGTAALDVTRKRLARCGSFAVLSTHRTERARWHVENGAKGVLAAYGATPIAQGLGIRDGEIVCVPAGERPTDDELDAACEAAQRRGSRRVHLLGWEFGELGEPPGELRRRASEQGLELELRTIPIELVRGARAPAFLPPAALDVAVRESEDGLAIELVRLSCPERAARGVAEPREVEMAELISGFMVDFRFDGVLFRPTVSFEQRRGVRLDLVTPAVARRRCGERACVAVTTIYGDHVTRVVALNEPI